MKYLIHNHTKEKVAGEVVREVVTLEVEYSDGSKSQHGFELKEGEDLKEASIAFAAQLEKVLKEPKVVEIEEVELTEQEKEIKKEDVEDKIEAEKVEVIE